MPNTRLAHARLSACRRWPAATSAILSLIPVERKGLGTLAVDKHWRLYFDPEYLATVSDETAALIILHEVSHLLLKHHQRGGAATDWHLWNVASDCSINHRLQGEGHAVPPEWLTPERFELPANLSAEQYYRTLEERKHVERDRSAGQEAEAGDASAREGDEAGSAAGTGQADNPEAAATEQGAADGAGAASAETGAGDGDSASPDAEGHAGGASAEAGSSQSLCPVEPGTSGSCADGQLRPWEEPPPAVEGEGTPTIEKHEQEQIIRRVAEAIEKGQGGGKGGWSDFVQQILHPKVDPRVLLSQAIRQAVEQVSGGRDDTSYRRPSRRPSVGGIIRPSRVALVPRIVVIMDSSGSMSQRDLGYALGLIGKVLSGFRLRDGVQVMVGDTAVQSCEKVFDPKRLKIIGGGGTEMGRLIIEAAKLKPRPQLIVVASDGITGWPREPVGIPVVACLTRDTAQHRVPSWIKSVVLA